MNQNNNERFIIIFLSLGGLGLTLESLILDWEFWVPPLIIIGAVFLWFMSITEKPDIEARKVVCLVYAMLCAFFHGVHESSFFDIAIVFSLEFLVFSFMNKVYMMNMLLSEFFILMFIQIRMGQISSFTFDKLSTSRSILHVLVECMVYLACVKVINNRIEIMKLEEEKDKRIEFVDKDMEDFLSNISHELRTPVNVVLGMAEMLIKKGVGEEVFSIKDAGRRLAYQIEDIQDYTECKRGGIMLEEEEYMSTSLINDVVMGFRFFDKENHLELIVDLDPKVPTKMQGDIKKLHKIFRHLLENAIKFTKSGGIYIRMYAEDADYGVNLCIEMTDTGIGMDNRTISYIHEGMYQANKKRNRSTGGIGLGLFITYGFTHSMGGFVKVESSENQGTTVRVTIPQKVTDRTPCLRLNSEFNGDIIFHSRSDKYKNPMVRDFYRKMATNLAVGIKVPLYSAENIKEIENLRKKLNVSFIFMGQEEYEEDARYYENLIKEGIVVCVTASEDFEPAEGSGVIVIPKILYSYPVIRVVNERKSIRDISQWLDIKTPVFKGIKALVVDDEPMNLVVATGILSKYQIEAETAGSGQEAIAKYRNGDFDVVLMDHMMPEMDGVEAMKQIKKEARDRSRNVIVIALTANAVSGARQMFMEEGFDGFIAKPINLSEFEHVMSRELNKSGK